MILGEENQENASDGALMVKQETWLERKDWRTLCLRLRKIYLLKKMKIEALYVGVDGHETEDLGGSSTSRTEEVLSESSIEMTTKPQKSQVNWWSQTAQEHLHAVFHIQF